jgi:hypothetical protein
MIASAFAPVTKQKAIMLIVLDNLQRKAWCVGVENVAQFSTSFIHGDRPKAGVELTRNRERGVRGSPLCHIRESGPRKRVSSGT